MRLGKPRRQLEARSKGAAQIPVQRSGVEPMLTLLSQVRSKDASLASARAAAAAWLLQLIALLRVH